MSGTSATPDPPTAGLGPTPGPPVRTPEIRAARTAAIAAVIAAVISAASGIFTYAATQSQIHAEDARSSTEFLRDQRKGTYGELIVAHKALNDLEKMFLTTQPPNSVADSLAGRTRDFAPAARDAIRVKVDAAYGKWLLSSAEVQIVGSPTAVDIVNSLADLHAKFSSNERPFHAIGADPDKEESNRLGELDDAYNFEDLWYNKFIAAARIDLNS